MLDDTGRLEAARSSLMPRVEPLAPETSASVQQTSSVDDEVMSLFFPARAAAPLCGPRQILRLLVLCLTLPLFP